MRRAVLGPRRIGYACPVILTLHRECKSINNQVMVACAQIVTKYLLTLLHLEFPLQVLLL